ncbi:MAG: hypothetical protein R6X08_03260 [Desulfosalsimonadaceae bacterium]
MALMSKTLAHRIFGIGKIPRSYREALRAEGIVWLEEGVRASITLRNYKAKGRRTPLRRASFSGSVCLTRRRIIAFFYSKRVISVPFNDGRITQLDVSAEDDKRLLCAFDAAAFDADREGTVECRFRIGRPADFVKQLQQLAV